MLDRSKELIPGKSFFARYFIPQWLPGIRWLRSRVGIACMAVILISLIFSLYITVRAFQEDTKDPKQNTLATYEHQGQFDYLAYVGAGNNDGQENKVSFFTKIMESVDLVFSYKFVADQPITIESSEIQVDAILSSPGRWQKEINLIPRTTQNPGEFTVQFPFDEDSINQYYTTIEEELGFRARSSDLPIVATVFTRAKRGSEELQDVFTASTVINAGALEFKLEVDSNDSKRGYMDDLGYTHLGRFGYEVKYLPNSLYGPVTYESKQKPSAARPVGPGTDLSGKSVDAVDLSFTYNFQSSIPIESLSESVEITGILENPGEWAESIVLVPKANNIDASTVNFYLNTEALIEKAQQKDEQLGVSEGKHRLDITAKVQTLARTDVKTIGEVYTQSLGLSLGKDNTIEFDGELSKTQTDLITETIWVTDTSVGKTRTWASIVSGLLFLLLSEILLGYYWAKPPKLPPADEEAKQAKRKHKDMILDVKEMPLMTVPDGLVELSALAELVRVADGMAKPVLHKVEDDNHIYLVITENAQYLYMSGERWKHFHPARRGNVFVNT